MYIDPERWCNCGQHVSANLRPTEHVTRIISRRPFALPPLRPVPFLLTIIIFIQFSLFAACICVYLCVVLLNIYYVLLCTQPNRPMQVGARKVNYDLFMMSLLMLLIMMIAIMMVVPKKSRHHNMMVCVWRATATNKQTKNGEKRE